MAYEYGVGPFEYCGIPFGGLGTGSFEVRADGHFYEWQIMNNHPWGHGASTTEMEDEGLFFGVCANDGEKPRVLMLNRPKWGDFNPSLSWESLRWTCDPYHMPWIEYPRKIDYVGRFPFANLAYETPGFPVAVELEAWSPFIPLDADNSGLPLAYLTFKISNRTRSKQTVSLFGALKNAVGYDHPDKRSLISVIKAGRATHLDFTRRGLPRGHESAGSMGFGVWSKKAGRTSHVLYAVHPRDIYDPVMQTGHLEDLDRGDFQGLVGNNLGGPTAKKDAVLGASRGGLCRTMSLQAGETAEVTFAITWFFPNQRQRTCMNGGDEAIGHWYANKFKSASEVME
jgi:non-lysosomal glucosylceramidase